jgi:hypothetical protein
MAILNQWRFLSTARINRIIGTLAAELEIRRPLNFLAMLPIVPAFDDELVGRFTGKIMAADVVADDQKAVVNEHLTLELNTNVIPNVKHGDRLGQKTLNRIKAIEENRMPMVGGTNRLKQWEQELVANLLLGVRWRMNMMAAAMMLDTFSYDRFGVKLSAVTWGMPSDLKVTPSVSWATAATATPISDILAIDQVARLKYGITYDKITMSTVDFRDMVATTEFANKATFYMGGGTAFLVTPAAIKTRADPETRELAMRILGKEIVWDDTVFNERAGDGSVTTTRALPLHKVLLSRKEDEGNADTWDFANGVPTESIVADMIGGPAPSGLGGEQFGPIAYYSTSSDLNAPDVVAWAVARCFPRKHVPEATAVLTVG